VLSWIKKYASGIIMDQRMSYCLGEIQCGEEILAFNEFDSPFPRFDILLRKGIIIL
jgi:hypothetical protein